MSDSSRSRSSLNATLWLAAGAAAGVAIGVFIAQRGGGRTLAARIRGLAELAQRWASDANDGDDEDEPEYDEYGAEVDEDEDAIEPPPIDERVLAAFEQDPILSARAIEIDTAEPDVVVLTGRVPSADDSVHAATIAGGVPGVARVDNRIRVR